jgi:acyl-CoA reductase-like NAD-dependent aldehyde dehydrogenase
MFDRKEHFIGRVPAAEPAEVDLVVAAARSAFEDVEPTIFVDVDSRMQIAQEEIFGPVLSVISHRHETEAIAIANDSVYGLGGAVFAGEAEHGLEVPGQVITGTCSVNGGPLSGSGGPFGGRKQSGLGREHAVEGLESFLELKSVALPAGYEPLATTTH